MKQVILIFSILLLALAGQSQTTGTWNKVVARDTLHLSGKSVAEIVYTLSATSKNNELPTAKAVYDYIHTTAVAIPETELAFGNATSDGLTSSPGLTYDGDYLHVEGDIDLIHTNAAVVVDDISSSSPSQGGTIYLNSKDNAALADGDRIGGASFLGSTGVGGSAQGAGVDAYADGAWGASESPSKIVFKTTPDGETTPADRLVIRQTGNIELLNGKEWQLWDSDNTHYVGFKVPATGTLTANRLWTLPADYGTNGYQLTTDGSGALSWTASSSVSSFYDTWKNNGTSATQRANANFIDNTDINVTLTDDAGNLETEIGFDIPDGAIDLSEMASVSTGILLGNSNVAPAAPMELSLSSQIEIDGITVKLAQNGATSGQVYKWNGSIWSPAAEGPGITLGSANQIFGVNNAGTANEYKTLSGTTNRVSVTHGAGTVTLSAPQDIHTGASPQFTSLSLINAGGSNVLTMSSAGSQTGVSMDGVSPYIYAVDKAPSGSNSGMSITFYNNDGAANIAGDRLGVFYFDGRGGSVERTCAQFAAFAEETLTSTSSPGYMSILTTPTGTTTPLERLRIAAGGSTQIRSANPLRFYDSDNTNYIGFVAPSLGSDVTLTWPSDAPTNGQQLTWNTGNTLSWDDAGSGGAAFYQTLQIGGTDQTQRGKLNISPTAHINVSYSDDAGGNRSNVEFSIANGAVGVDEIEAGAVNQTHLSDMGASTGQALIYDGASWNAANIKNDATASDLSADVNDYEPTGWETNDVFFLSSDATIRTITGFAALAGGTERTLVNDDAEAFVIACGHTGSDIANRVVGPSDFLVLPGGSITLVYNSDNSKWYVKDATFEPSQLGRTHTGLYFYQAPGATNQSDHPFLGLAVSGTGAANANASPITDRPQSWELTTGTTAAGVATVYLPKNANNFTTLGQAHVVAQGTIWPGQLSTSGQRFTLQFGLVPSANSTTLAVNNSIVIRYKDDVNSGKFEFVTRNNAGTETAVDCGITVAANVPYNVTITCNKARTEARCYVNGALVAINTGTMPNSVAVGARFGGFASVGTSAKFINISTISAWCAY